MLPSLHCAHQSQSYLLTYSVSNKKVWMYICALIIEQLEQTLQER